MAALAAKGGIVSLAGAFEYEDLKRALRARHKDSPMILATDGQHWRRTCTAEFGTCLIARRCRRIPHASLPGLSKPWGLSYVWRVPSTRRRKLTNGPKTISLKGRDLPDNAQFKLKELSVSY